MAITVIPKFEDIEAAPGTVPGFEDIAPMEGFLGTPEEIEARQQDILRRFPGLYDSPLTPKQQDTLGVDRPKHIDQIWWETGRDRSQVIQDFRAVDATPSAWGVSTPEEARALVLKKAQLEGRRTLGEELTDTPLIDALGLVPFSPLHEWEKRRFYVAKTELERRSAPFPFEPMAGEEMTAEQMNMAAVRAQQMGGLWTMPTEELKEIVRDYELQQARGLTVAAQVGKGAAALASYISEFAVGGEIAGSLGLKTVGELARRPKTLVNLAKTVGTALTQAGITTTIQPHRVTAALIDYEMDGEEGMVAVAKAYGSVYVENLTELTGEAFTGVGVAILERLPFGGKLLSRLRKEAVRLGLSEAQFLGKIATKGGWNGFLGEVGEERLNTILYGIFSLDDFGAGPDSTIRQRVQAGLEQDLQVENMLVESMVLMTPGGVKLIGNQVAKRMPANRDMQAALDLLSSEVVADQQRQVAEEAVAEAEAVAPVSERTQPVTSVDVSAQPVVGEAEAVTGEGATPVAEVTPEAPKVEQSLAIAGKDKPLLLRTHRPQSSTIYMTFDRTQPSPTAEELQGYLNDNDIGAVASVTRFNPDVISTTDYVVNYRVDVWNEKNALSGELAKKLYDQKIGAGESYTAESKATREIPLKQRLGAVIQKATEGELGIKSETAPSTAAALTPAPVTPEAKQTKPVQATEEQQPGPPPTTPEGPALNQSTQERLAEPEPERLISRAAERINEEAIARDLTESLGELPTYERMSMAEQAQMSAAEIARDYENAKRMAYGQAVPPAGLRAASIYRAVAVKAGEEGDVETLRNLAIVHPAISEELTALGQAIKAADAGIDGDPVRAIRDVAKYREKSVSKRKHIKDIKAKKREVAGHIRSSIRQQVTHRQSWSEFVASIRC